ncbi:TonB-dependent siderophore receptor [Mangrovimonas sp. YM274]|uniref:TonB-dependent receptor plug domain-containing protein n=1 Tax=Mangrovimonas sp. YM274 TaxID=3070660 RepID=UPI0027DE40FF|nr:TonB-dependent receptor plug domain-containing protein [Mangrovimonas sp. YM274]WMI67960.1 TonB-dependent receptor plug domain-containing protein [Mangrovimonas sp. YM274]
MNKKEVIFLFISLFFLGINKIVGQQNSKAEVPLTSILSTLEDRYNIHFSYIDKTVDSIYTTLPPDHISLEEALALLKANTNLDFILIDKKSVVISKRINPLSEVITQKLEEVVVSNYLTRGISLKNDGKVTIETKKFGILPGLIEPDILQTIQALPGIISVNETVSNINVRGGTHDENLILWDGIKMYQSGHFFGLVSAFNPYLTKSVDVSKNGTSVRFGDGVSSLINMKQSNSLDQDFKAGTGFNLISADIFSKIPLSEQTEIQIAARRSISDLLITPTYDQYYEKAFQDSDLSGYNNETSQVTRNNEHFYFYDISTKFLYDITDSDQLRFNFLTIRNDLNYDKQTDNNGTLETLKSSLQQDNLALGTEYLKYWNSKLTTTTQVYWSSYHLNTTNHDLINDQRLKQKNKVSDLGIRINATNHLDKNLKIHGGYQFNGVVVTNSEDVNNPQYQDYSKEINRTHSLYGEAEFTSANKNTYARIGLRTNIIEKFNDVYTEPRLSVSHKLNKDFRAEVLAEFKSQTMAQIIDLQNDFLGIEKRRWMLSNGDNIPIIESKQASAGIHYNKNKLLISTEVFVKNVEGINSRSQGFQNQYQFLNTTGSYFVKGIDFLIHKQFKSTSAWLSYSNSSNNYNFEEFNEGNNFPNNLDIKHALTFAGTYQMNNLKVALGVNWHSGKPTTLPASIQDTSNNTIEYSSPNSNNLKDYLRTDVSANYSFRTSQSSHAIIGMSIWNLLNRKNVVNTYYTLNEDTVSKVDIISLGITPNVSFRLNF